MKKIGALMLLVMILILTLMFDRVQSPYPFFRPRPAAVTQVLTRHVHSLPANHPFEHFLPRWH
jgi:hypothetical protein